MSADVVQQLFITWCMRNTSCVMLTHTHTHTLGAIGDPNRAPNACLPIAFICPDTIAHLLMRMAVPVTAFIAKDKV